MEKKKQTKFGTAILCRDGYYHITSRKEGNCGKKLSRLIYEDYHGVKLSSETHIHHIDGDKSNDDIENLEALTESEHHSHHMIGEKNPNYKKEYGLDERLDISKTSGSSGIYRVTKTKAQGYRLGFKWLYQCVDENGKPIQISSIDIHKLKQKVLDRRLDWIILDEEKAKASMEM